MNIKDEKLIDLRKKLFVKRDGEIIEHQFFGHAKMASIFFGIDSLMPEKERLENKKRFLMYKKYCNQFGYIDLLEFMIRFYGHDRCCTFYIITARPNPYETYFNHYLSGYGLHILPPIAYDEALDTFYTPEIPPEDIEKDLAFKAEADELRNSSSQEELSIHFK